MRKLIHICVLLILLFHLCSCAKQKEINIQSLPKNEDSTLINMEVSPECMNIIDLISTKYSDAQLNEINEAYESITDLDSVFPIECIRQEKNHYRVVYCSNDKYLVLYFSEYGFKEYGRIFTMSKPATSFDTLVGKSCDAVQKHDPAGDYTCFYTGRNDLFSDHYTLDGFLLHVSYSENGYVTEITSELI